MSDFVLGIDTSNYTTSVAVADMAGNIVCDERIMLSVRKGQRGLRQQEALFQHIYNLPTLIERALKKASGCEDVHIGAVAVSARPRPVKDSYMPVFLAGVSVGKSVASALGVPCYEFSHQEGHIASASGDEKYPYAFHMSGGTCELLKITYEDAMQNDLIDISEIEIIGGSKDISFGQVMDRIGVAMGEDFPCGAVLDKIALAAAGNSEDKMLTPVKVKERQINLSGLETQAQRLLLKYNGYKDHERIVYDIFTNISDSIVKMTDGLSAVLLIGGVSESEFIKKKLKNHENLHFAPSEKGRDNAMGTALLGVSRLKNSQTKRNL